MEHFYYRPPHCAVVDKFAVYVHRAFAAKDCAQHVCKGVSVKGGLDKGCGVVLQRRFSN